MSFKTNCFCRADFSLGIKDALPLLSGYIPVAISFGVIAVESGFSLWQTILISTFIYAGSSQFLFVAMVGSGANLWLTVGMTLLINARHIVYSPSLSPYVNNKPLWFILMHGLTDQVYALAHNRLPKLHSEQRLGWFAGLSLLAWFSWIGGTAIGAIMGDELMTKWPVLQETLPFSLPALFLVLLAPRLNNLLWTVTIIVTIVIAMLVKLNGFVNISIPLAAICGALLYTGTSVRVNR